MVAAGRPIATTLAAAMGMPRFEFFFPELFIGCMSSIWVESCNSTWPRWLLRVIKIYRYLMLLLNYKKNK